MISRAWYLVAGALAVVLLVGSGYYVGHEREADRWALARAALADSADSARARAGRADAKLAVARAKLDSTLAAWDRLIAEPPRLHVVHDTVHAPSDTSSVFFGQAWWHPGLDQLQMQDERDTAVAAVKACQAVVAAAINYRTACETVRDSLAALNATLAQQLAARLSAPRQRPIGVVIGPSLTLAPDSTLAGPWRVRPGISVTVGWRLW